MSNAQAKEDRALGKRLTTREVAKIFNTTPATIRRWARQRKLPCVKTPGGRYLFDEDVLNEYIRTLTVDLPTAEETPPH